MNGQSFILLLIVISSIHCTSMPNSAKVLKDMCRARLKAIKAGTLEKLIKDREAMKETGFPKDVLTEVNKCEEAMPMSTADQVTKICADKKANLAKFTELIKCVQKALTISTKSTLGTDAIFS